MTLALAALLTGALACGGELPNSVSYPSPLAAQISVQRASVQVTSGVSAPHVSVSCPVGTQLIGGGFSASDVFEYDALVTASYPAGGDLRTWTVVAGHSAAFTLTAEAYCLSHGPDLRISLHATNGPQAFCPPPTSTLSAGFNGAIAYALCASQHASDASLVHTTFNPRSSSDGYEPSTVTLACPTGALAMGGVISGGDRLLSSFSAGAPYLNWTFVVGGDDDTTVTTICANILGSGSATPTVRLPAPTLGP